MYRQQVNVLTSDIIVFEVDDFDWCAIRHVLSETKISQYQWKYYSVR